MNLEDSNREKETWMINSRSAMRERDGSSHQECKRQVFVLLLSLSVLALAHSVFNTGSALADQPKKIKSYEIEMKVFNLCNESEKYIKSRDFGEALLRLKQAEAFDPTSYSGYVHENIAECYRGQGKNADAIKELEKALSFESDCPKALYWLSQNYFDSKHYDTASFYLKKLLAVNKDPQWQKPARDLLDEIDIYGNALTAVDQINAGHYESARKCLELAAKKDPSRISANVHANLAYVFRQLGKPEQSVLEGKKALQYNSKDKDAVYGLAIAYQDLGDFDNAILYLRQYVGMEPVADEREKASDLIQDLMLDRMKVNSAVLQKPDYLDSMVDGSAVRRWPQRKLPIKIHIADGSKVKGYKAKYPKFITRAMDIWSNASGNKLSYNLVKSPQQADIKVVWVSVPLTLTEGHKIRKKQGLATVQPGYNNEIESAIIEVDTMNGYESSKELHESEAASVCLHEVGHSLGLFHSPSVNDVMYYGSSSKQSPLPTKRDQATIARLYASYPVSNIAPPVKKIEPIKFMPPPAFAPPVPSENEDLVPPMFVPPPVEQESEKLTPPPFFEPPVPVKSKELNSKMDAMKKSAPPAVPMFVPPPVSKTPLQKARGNGNKKKEDSNLPFFTPPPVNP